MMYVDRTSLAEAGNLVAADGRCGRTSRFNAAVLRAVVENSRELIVAVSRVRDSILVEYPEMHRSDDLVRLIKEAAVLLGFVPVHQQVPAG